MTGPNSEAWFVFFLREVGCSLRLLISNVVLLPYTVRSYSIGTEQLDDELTYGYALYFRLWRPAECHPYRIRRFIMPLYLCALTNVSPLILSDNCNAGGSNCLQLEFSYIKNQKLRGNYNTKNFQSCYLFRERKIYQLSDSLSNYLYWRDKIDWCLGFNTVFKSKKRPFALLKKLQNTIFGEDCKILAEEFQEWSAFIEAESLSESSIYRTFQTLHQALDFAKNDGALWYFTCDEPYIDSYLRAKKYHWAIPL